MSTLHEWFPVMAVGVPILIALGLLYLFVAGVIGTATALVSTFSLTAFAITAVVLHGNGDDEDEAGPQLRL